MLYRAVVDAAVERLGADSGGLQLAEPDRRGLRLVVSRGIHPASAAFWEFVPGGSALSCGTAAVTGERVIMADVEAVAALSGTPNLGEYRRSGVRGVQSTPLLAHDGAVLGVLSTHWHRPHTPQPRELRVVDDLAQELVQALVRATPPPPGAPAPQDIASRQYSIRIVNRRIAASVGPLDSAFAEITGERGTATFLCACGRESCRNVTLTIPLAVYDRLRVSPHQFLVHPGHAVEQVDRIVESGDGYQIVEIRPEFRRDRPSASGEGHNGDL